MSLNASHNGGENVSNALILSYVSLQMCCAFADSLSATVQTHDGLACALDVPQQTVSSSSVSISLVNCKTLKSLSNFFEALVQRAPISPRMAKFGFSILTISGDHFTAQLKCTFNFVSSVAMILDPYSCVCPVPKHLAEYLGDIFVTANIPRYLFIFVYHSCAGQQFFERF
jgi:hypothetical protein